MKSSKKRIAHFHLPGLFEFYELYKIFLPLFYEHREYFYDWCDIGSIYGAPGDALWGGGRVGYGERASMEVLSLMKKFNISARLTFSNSLLREEHFIDRECNEICDLFRNSPSDDSDTKNIMIKDNRTIVSNETTAKNGIIVYSDLLLRYIEENYPGFYFVSTTTKVITDFKIFEKELNREEFAYVVADFRLNKEFEKLGSLSDAERSKVEFLCNECCWFGCNDRKSCYESVSRNVLGEGEGYEHICHSMDANEGYVFSKAMKSPGFIGIDDIRDVYLPMGFSNFKIEGRSLGSAMILEFLLYYMTKLEYQLQVREKIYLDNSLDLF